MATVVFVSGIAFIVLGFGAFALAVRFRKESRRGISKTAIYTFVGFGFIALGSLLFMFGYFRYFYGGVAGPT